MGRTLALIVALALGLGSALLVASCGDDSPSPSIPPDSAQELLAILKKVESEFDEKNCTVAELDAQDLIDEVQALPDSVDKEVLDALEEGAKQLRDLMEEDCEEPETTTETTEETEEETTETTETTEEEPTETEVPTFPTTPTEPEPPPSGGTGL